MAKDFAKPFYDSKVWKDTRKQILRRASFTCEECGVERASEVHHIIPLTPDNINDPSITLNPKNLRALGSVCHKKITKGASDVVAGYVFDDQGNVVPE